MRTLVKIALVAAVMVAPMGAMSDEEGDVKYRQLIMKGMSAHAGAISQIAKGKVSQDAALERHADALLELTKMIPSAFKNNSMAGKTRATEKIWSDWAGFDSKSGKFERDALAVATAAKSGPSAVKGALKELFSNCKSCHDDYRASKKK
jgi:cytochrome c556